MRKAILRATALITFLATCFSGVCFATENEAVPSYIPMVRTMVNIFCIIFIVLAVISLIIVIYSSIVKKKTESKRKELLKNKSRLTKQQEEDEDASESVRVISEDMEDEINSLDQEIKICSSRISFFRFLFIFSLIIPIIKLIVL